MAPDRHENAALVRRFLLDVVGGGDTDAARGFVTPAFVERDLVFGTGQPRDELARLGWRVLAGADVDIDVRDVIASGDAVAVIGRVAGTHRESMVDLAPTGRSFDIDCAWFCGVEDGRLAEIASLPNGLGLLRQLEAVPETFPIRPPFRSTTNEQT